METTGEKLLDRIDRYIEEMFPARDGLSAALAEALKSSETQGPSDWPRATLSMRVAKAYSGAIARHPRLDSIVLPILRARVDGIAISIVKYKA